jgi:hypothetical protein
MGPFPYWPGKSWAKQLEPGGVRGPLRDVGLAAIPPPQMARAVLLAAFAWLVVMTGLTATSRAWAGSGAEGDFALDVTLLAACVDGPATGFIDSSELASEGADVTFAAVSIRRDESQDEPCIRAARFDGPDAPAPLCTEDATSNVAPGVVRRVARETVEASVELCPSRFAWAQSGDDAPTHDPSTELHFEPATLPSPAALPRRCLDTSDASAAIGLEPALGVVRSLERPPTAR